MKKPKSDIWAIKAMQLTTHYLSDFTAVSYVFNILKQGKEKYYK